LTDAPEGRDIILISSDLPEIFGLTDRLLVLHEGSLAATLTNAEIARDKVLNYAAGLGTPTKEDALVSSQKLDKREEQP
jgi:ABC-type sugar transport system ATPase subunit